MTTEPDTGNMPGFPSDEWVAWLDSILSECRVAATTDLVLEYHVSDDDSSVYRWHVRIASGRVSAAPGRSGGAPGQAIVVLASDRDTAREIAIEGKSAHAPLRRGGCISAAIPGCCWRPGRPWRPSERPWPGRLDVYLRKRLVVLSASTLPPVWQLGQ